MMEAMPPFGFNLTDHFQAENVLAVSVDNSKNDRVYLQKARFYLLCGLYAQFGC